jgi:hypothetical protein
MDLEREPFSRLSEPELKRLITHCLARHFTPTEMCMSLKTNALIVGHLLAGAGLGPQNVAVALYELACREDRVDNLIDAILEYPGREQAVQECLFSGISSLGSGLPSGRTPEFLNPDVQTLPSYEDILQIIQSTAKVMERNPHSFKTMGEEDLRNHFLVQLNGHFRGKATGETFNHTGKTDILIRVNDENVFIAECKFWRGSKGLTNTIDQLLGYVNWRDTKTAIVLFNRNENFSDVLAKIPDVVRDHAHFKRKTGVEEETVFRYVFRHPRDPERKLLLTVLAFNIPRET